MDDDLTEFSDLTDDLVGDIPDEDDAAVPEFTVEPRQRSRARSLRQRLRRGFAILIPRRGSPFRWRDRVPVLVNLVAGIVVSAALLSIVLDHIGPRSGMLWTLQVQARRALLAAFAFLGDMGMYALNNELVPLAFGAFVLSVLWRWRI